MMYVMLRSDDEFHNSDVTNYVKGNLHIKNTYLMINHLIIMHLLLYIIINTSKKINLLDLFSYKAY